MKRSFNINRSGKAALSILPESPSGVQISPRGVAVVDYEVFLVAKGLNTFGIGELISPDDYFSPNKSMDVYALLCARPESATIGESLISVYPIFFIARLAGMSQSFVLSELTGECRTLCLDVVQRVGASDSLAPMQHRVFMNLRVHSPQDVGSSGVIFRPSWDRYISLPDEASAYEQAVHQTEWSALSGDPALSYRVLDGTGGTLLGPFKNMYSPVSCTEMQLRTSDIRMRSDWAIWCGQANDGPNERPVPLIEFASSLSSPCIGVFGAGSEVQGFIWTCLLASGSDHPSLVPIAYNLITSQWGNSFSGDLLIYSLGLQYNA